MSIPDLTIIYDKAFFEKYNMQFRQLNITLENGKVLNWQPGADQNFMHVLEYDDKSITVFCTLVSPCGEVETVPAITLQVEKDPVRNRMNTIDIVKQLVLEYRAEVNFHINPETHYGAVLKSINIEIPDCSSRVFRQWKPGDQQSFTLLLKKEVFLLPITWEAATDKNPTYVLEGEYSIQHGLQEITIDAGPFANAFIYVDDNTDFHIVKAAQGIYLDAQLKNPANCYTITLPRTTAGTPLIYFVHDYNILYYTKNYQLFYKRNPDGTYGTPVIIDGWPAECIPLFTGDFNRDTKEDLLGIKTEPLAGGYYNFYYAVFPGLGSGQFDFSIPLRQFITGQWLASYTVADINNDNEYDLLYYSNDSGVQFATSVYALYGMGDGTLAANPVHILTDPDHSVLYIAAGDADNDGFVDILAGADDDTYDTGQLALYINQGNCTFIKEPEFIDCNPFEEYTVPDKFQVSSTFIDYNADGWLDIMCWESFIIDGFFRCSIQINDGSGHYNPYGNGGYTLIPYTNNIALVRQNWFSKPRY